MDFNFYHEVEKLVKELSSKYEIDEDSYSVHFGKNLDYFLEHPHERGDCGILEPQHQLAILLNRRLLTTLPELKTTFRHEFRHVWQRNMVKQNGGKCKIGYWIGWCSDNEKAFGSDAYLFSPTELDSNRFARSGGELDDCCVFNECKPHPRAYQELRENQLFAANLALREGFHVLSEDTAQRLIDLSLLDSQAYTQWLMSRFDKSRLF